MDIENRQVLIELAKSLFYYGYRTEKPTKSKVRQRAEIRAKFTDEEFAKIENEILRDAREKSNSLEDCVDYSLDIARIDNEVNEKICELYNDNYFKKNPHINSNLLSPHLFYIKYFLSSYLLNKGNNELDKIQSELKQHQIQTLKFFDFFENLELDSHQDINTIEIKPLKGKVLKIHSKSLINCIWKAILESKDLELIHRRSNLFKLGKTKSSITREKEKLVLNLFFILKHIPEYNSGTSIISNIQANIISIILELVDIDYNHTHVRNIIKEYRKIKGYKERIDQ